VSALYVKAYPRFVLPVVPERVLLPKGMILVAFAIILYVIIYINYLLLGDSVPIAVHIILGVSFLVLLVIETLWTYLAYAKFRYEFYDTHILVRGPHTYRIGYDEVSAVSCVTSFFDRFTHTATIVLANSDHRYNLRHVSASPDVYNRIEQLVHTGRRGFAGADGAST
jgi:hypothetical protein